MIVFNPFTGNFDFVNAVADPQTGLAILGTNVQTSNMNSTTLIDTVGLSIPLDVGTYLLSTTEIIGDSNFSIAGCKTKLVFTGTWSISGDIVMRAQDGLNAQPVNVTPSYGSIFDLFLDTLMSSIGSFFVQRTAKAVVTVAGDFKHQSAQNAATASNHFVYAGSNIRATRIIL